MSRTLILMLSSMLPIAGCTWVALSDEGRAVRVVQPYEVSGCTRRGEVTASVRREIGPYERDSRKVSDEVEALARNEAASLGADTITPAEDLRDGQRRYVAWACRRG